MDYSIRNSFLVSELISFGVLPADRSSSGVIDAQGVIHVICNGVRFHPDPNEGYNGRLLKKKFIRWPHLNLYLSVIPEMI